MAVAAALAEEVGSVAVAVVTAASWLSFLSLH